MYKKVLVAVDTSDESEEIIEYGARLRSETTIPMIIAHVVDLPSQAYVKWFTEVFMGPEQIKQASEARLIKLTEDLAIPVSVRVEIGHCVSKLLEIATKEQVEVIVLGQHTRHGLNRYLGATAIGVLHHANCDVLAVKLRERTT